MQQIVENNAIFLVGSNDMLMKVDRIPALPIFSERVLNFLYALSDELLHDKVAKKYGDIIAYAFWIRRASIEKEYQKYVNYNNRIGKGVAFQIAPSNIPVQFVVSMTYALVAGNISVVRVSQKDFQQVEIICNAINRVIKEKCQDISEYVYILKYDHNSDITRYLTDKCDIRMIWGGDYTIQELHKIPSGAQCLDIGFADRYSIAIIDADSYLEEDAKVIAKDFYNDTYYTDQNACSSTRLVVWTGVQKEEARKRFWEALESEVEKKYEMDDICGSEKLLRTAICAMRYPGVKEIRKNNAIVRLELHYLSDDIMNYKGNCGYFFEYETDNIESIVPVLQKRCQTITYLGTRLREEISSVIHSFGVRGGDRIVLMGHSMDLSFVWDGYDMPLTLSRVIGSY